jgi:S-DNA-T family DNA segregation ATPase FtsK/SpoIIIE
VELLSVGAQKTRAGDDEVRINSDRLEAAFRSFGVNVNISTATRGPAVTRYEAELEAGIKLSRLTSLADDIALALGTSGVRIAAMPNKISTVGIEVPNKNISKVYLRNIIESQAFANAKSKLTFAIGMDISGDAIVGNVSKLPHMLVAGTTGSGKSVCLNSFILSILYKATPDDVRFIMIDPKMVEFKVYNNIPHLLVPVVTDIKKAAGALQWAVFEMMKRYTLFAETSARDIYGYNQIAYNSNEREPLPQIIVVIDELADLMMMAAKEVEESVCRVAQMGRAAGMHLIIATQSPRADVITGLMKANIPSRIAFKVSSALESRIILDAGGNADKLVGNGDMLYAPIGTNKPMRVQGTWVSDKEREIVVDFIKRSGETHYSEEVMDEIEKAAVEKPSGDKQKDEQESADYDELLPQAVGVIFETGQASVSMLQRRLKLGYSRAARIVDQMEQMGIVGPFEGSKPRALLITKDQWRQMQYVNGTAPIEKTFPNSTASIYDYRYDQDDDNGSDQ